MAATLCKHSNLLRFSIPLNSFVRAGVSRFASGWSGKTKSPGHRPAILAEWNLNYITNAKLSSSLCSASTAHPAPSMRPAASRADSGETP
jgi:hypothetical protein